VGYTYIRFVWDRPIIRFMWGISTIRFMWDRQKNIFGWKNEPCGPSVFFFYLKQCLEYADVLVSHYTIDTDLTSVYTNLQRSANCAQWFI